MTLEILTLEQIKDQIDLRAFVMLHPRMSTSPMEARRAGHGTSDKYFSPKTNEDTPSFAVFSNGTWKDFSNGEGGNSDIFDFLQYVDGLNLQDAADYCRQFLNEPTSVDRMAKLKTERRKTVEWSQDWIGKRADEFHTHLDEAMPYYESRGISRFQAESHHFGLFPLTYEYRMADKSVVKFVASAYTIPYLLRTDNKVITRSMELRVNELAVAKAWEKLTREQPQIAYVIEKELNGRQVWEAITAKYKRWGENRFLFNANRLITIRNGQVSYNRLPQVAVVETAMDAAMLESMGYAAVAIPEHDDIDLKQAFQSVSDIVLMRDNDRAGLDKATNWAERIGVSKCRFLTPENHKDAGEFRQTDLHAFDAWLEANNLCKTLC